MFFQLYQQEVTYIYITNDDETAIRNAISIGGDTDRIACIFGGMAEVSYGVSKYWIEK